MPKKEKIDYKKIIADKRLEAGKLMTQAQMTKANVLIHSASVACGAAGAIPIPIADAIPISAAQVSMVIALGKIFDQTLSEGVAKGIIGAAASTLVGRSLVKLIPIAGWFISAGVAAAVTEAIGWTVTLDFAKQARKEWQRQKNAVEAAKAYAEAEKYKKADENNNEDAEDFSKQ